MSTALPNTTSKSEIQRIFDSQKKHRVAMSMTSSKERISKLKRLHDTVIKYREEIKFAMYEEYKKPGAEVDMSEIYVITSEIKHAISNLSKWMKKESVSTPLALFGASSYIQREAKGVSLIIVPWNFPLQLGLGPLVSAISAGCTAMIKPSEFTPLTSLLMHKIVSETFEEKEVAVIQGGVETSTMLLTLHFDHIFFTGSTTVGKIVMEAAAKHLTSLTLELGGKSPTIVDETANLEVAAKRITIGKFFNCGQICIAPDYILVHHSKKDQLVAELRKAINELYTFDVETSSSYARIVNIHHYNRLMSYLEDAKQNGATVEHGGKCNAEDLFIEPTILCNVPMNALISKEEIFGPLLPIYTYSEKEEILEIIGDSNIPLSAYIYSTSSKNIEHFMTNTRAGGSCINFNCIHFYNNHLPFGGFGTSGFGKAHGKYGFDAFSNRRAVLRQNFKGAIEILIPPYNNFKQKIIDLTIKWL